MIVSERLDIRPENRVVVWLFVLALVALLAAEFLALRQALDHGNSAGATTAQSTAPSVPGSKK